MAVLNRYFGGVLLHELTAHRIEQFKRERLAGRWRACGQKSAAKPVRPATVNRELDTLRMPPNLRIPPLGETVAEDVRRPAAFLLHGD